MKDVYFGFNRRDLLIRVDFESPARAALADFDTLRISFVEPPGWELLVESPGRPKQTLRLLHHGREVAAPELAFGVEQIAELSVPFARLGVQVDQPVQFFVELLQGRQSRDRAPREGTINLTCPSPDFEQLMWDV